MQINMWYQRLDERYNFSLGGAILHLMTPDNLKLLATLDPPFLQHHRDVNDQQGTIFGMIQIS